MSFTKTIEKVNSNLCTSQSQNKENTLITSPNKNVNSDDLPEWHQWQLMSNQDLKEQACTLFDMQKVAASSSFVGAHAQNLYYNFEVVDAIKSEKRSQAKIIVRIKLNDKMKDKSTQILNKHLLTELLDIVPLTVIYIFDNRIKMTLHLSIEFFDIGQAVLEDYLLIETKLLYISEKSSITETVVINPVTNEIICKSNAVIGNVVAKAKL
eukprot:403341528